MLGNGVDDDLAEAVLARDFDTIPHRRHDGAHRKIRRQSIEHVAAALVFVKRIGPHRLADPMIERHDPAFERVDADRLTRRLRQIGDQDGMVIGAGRVKREILQDRAVRRGELQQAHIGHGLEDALQKRQQRRAEEPGH